MIVSRNWLQNYIKEPLPSAEKIEEGIIYHSFEVEGVTATADGDTLFDIKVLPDRASSCLSHRGIAREIAAIFDLTFVDVAEPFTAPTEAQISANPADLPLSASIDDAKLCRRYSALLITGVSASPSPQWLREALEKLGQKSINSIVDITNYVMFASGQPMHAFDAAKVGKSIRVGAIKSDQKFLALDNKEYDLPAGTLCILDGADTVLGVAGIKGGMHAAVDEKTNSIILEAANFDATAIRKTSQKINLRTDASKRFENAIAPGFTTLAIGQAVDLIKKLNPSANVSAFADVYPRPEVPYKIGVSASEASALLGTEITGEKIEDTFRRLGFDFKKLNPHEVFMKSVESSIGSKYLYAASIRYDAPRAFDCSSLCAWAAVEAGVSIPRTSIDQYIYCEKVSREDMKPGDLIFSNTGKGTNFHYETKEFMPGTKVPEGIDHVGVYMGKDESGADTVLHTTRYVGHALVEKISEAENFKTIIGIGRISAAAEGAESRYVVEVPFDRVDLRRRENIIEEIGRIVGYENIPDTDFAISSTGAINKEYFYTEKLRALFIEQGFSEVFTYAFQSAGEVEVENPLASDKKFLRADLSTGMATSLEMNTRNADILGMRIVKQFEIGKVFTSKGEKTVCAFSVTKDSVKEIKSALAALFGAEVKTYGKNPAIAEFDLDDLITSQPEAGADSALPPFKPSDATFTPISQYPFASRDIAVFIPGTAVEPDPLGILISETAGPLLVRLTRFDVFTKEGKDGEPTKTSYAYRMVFQSQEKTLSDTDINQIMEKINSAIATKADWKVR